MANNKRVEEYSYELNKLKTKLYLDIYRIVSSTKDDGIDIIQDVGIDNPSEVLWMTNQGIMPKSIFIDEWDCLIGNYDDKGMPMAIWLGNLSADSLLEIYKIISNQRNP